MMAVKIANILAILFDLWLLTKYFYTFFSRKIKSKLIFSMIYFLATIFYYYSSVYFPISSQRAMFYFFVCMGLSFCYQGAFTYKLLLVAVYSGLGVITESVTSSIFTILSMVYIPITVDSRTGYIAGLIFSSFLFFGIIMGIRFVWTKILKQKFQHEHLLKPHWDIFFSVFIITTVVIIYMVEYLVPQQELEDRLAFFTILRCMLLIFDIVIIFIFREMEHLQQEKLHTVLLRQQNEAQEIFYKESIQKNEQLKRIVHDEKNFLLGTIGLLREKQNEKAIQRMEEKVEQLVGNVTDFTGNMALDTILTAKRNQAAQFQINLYPAIALYGKVNIDFLDLVVLLGNALDNAIQETRQVKEIEKRAIHISMRLQGIFLFLEVRNPVRKKVSIQKNTIVSDKLNEKGLHGLGIGNMKLITEKYHGKLFLDCNETTFFLRIYLENECGKHETD